MPLDFKDESGKVTQNRLQGKPEDRPVRVMKVRTTGCGMAEGVLQYDSP